MSAHPSTPLGSCVLRVETWNPLRADPDEEFRYIDLSAVDQDTKSITEAREIACADAPSRARQLVRTGDVLVSTVRPNLNGVARVPDDLDGATASTGFCVLRPDPEKLSGSYLFHWVKSPAFVSNMVNKATGASYPAVSDRIILDSSFPLPPLEEQRRIATILDQAETLRTQRRTALALLDSLTQSLFLDMFGDPVANPKGFPTCLLGDVIEFVGGSQPAKEHFSFEPSPDSVRLVQIRDFRSDEFKTYIPRKLARRFFDVDDVMIGRYGPPVFQIFRGLSGSYNVALMKALPKAGVLRDFIFFLLQEPGLHGYVVDRSTRTAGQSGVNLELLENYPAFRPPLPLQQTFATRIASIEALKATHRRALAALDALFASLQQRAFSGELTLPAPRSPAQSLEQLQKLEASIGLEALIFIAKRMPDGNVYNSLKAIYFADRHHLEHHGHQIYSETYCALPHGPVPQSAYDATRVLIGERMFSDFDDDAMRAALRRNDKKLTALRDADFSKLSRSVVESLEWAVRYCSDMKFGQTKTASHDSAYERTPKNEAIPLQYIIDTLPPEARQRHWNL